MSRSGGLLSAGSSRVVALGNRATDYALAVNGDENVLLTATLTGNWTLSITGQSAGATVTLELTQDGTGGRVVTLPAGTDPLGSFALDSAAGATSLITLYTPDGTSWRRFKAGAGSLALGVSSTTAAAGNDARLRTRNIPPQALGLIAQTFNPIEWSTTSAAGTFTADNLILTQIWLPSPQTITNIVAYIKTAGATLTSGHNFCSLWDASGNRIGATADQSTPWQTAGLKTMALAGGPLAWAGGTNAFLYVGFQWAGTTFPQLMIRAMNGDTTWANLNTPASAPIVTGFSGQTGLPAGPLTLASGSLQAAYPWFAVS